ncbi:sugar phosphate isomerase/epimerase family protein [Urechidicola croceus]|uniref:Sugar phosphate isomerase n=1 Tax=Urechidicola croceus TaxID=1850246 RepID=A0A1D8P5H2_9FLAO|nr:sugar phosphate isomerase/epimerase [Urechidicola croceus]AOW19801.1 sugar phosphate isomerase [Urechidicola croceus]
MKYVFKILFAIVLLVLVSSCKNSVPDKSGGLALYTLRDEMSKNPKEILKKVSDIGYKYIEAAGYDNGKFYGMAPEEFKSYVLELGLTPLSTHQSMVTLENADEMIAQVKAAGFTYFVIPIPPMGHFKFDSETRSMSMSEDIELVTNIINVIGKKCHDVGLELLYHNHDFEFKKNVNGITPIDYFLNNTNPEYVNFQMDLYWVTKAGVDPVSYFKKYPGRFKAWHVKDMDDQGRFAPVGTGTIDFDRIFENKELAGMKYFFVEQDKTFDDLKPLDAVKISHEGLKNIQTK